MLLLLFSLFSHYGLHQCTENEATFNETLLTEQFHQSLLQANAFLEGMHEEIHHGKSELRVKEYESPTKYPNFFDYSITNVWWKDSLRTGENTPQTSYLTTPENNLLNTATPYPIGIFTIPTTLQTISSHPYFTYPDYIPKFGHSPDVYPGTITISTHKDHPFPVPATSPVHTPRPPPSPPHFPGSPISPDAFGPPQTNTPFIPPTPDYTFEIPSETPIVPPTPDYADEMPPKTPFIPQYDALKSPGYTFHPDVPKVPPFPISKINTFVYYRPTTPLNVTEYDYPTDPSSVSPAVTMTGFTTLHPNISVHVKEWTSGLTDPAAQTHTVNPPTPEPTPQTPDWIQNENLDSNASHYRTRSAHREGVDYISTPDPQYPGHPTAMGMSGKIFFDANGLMYLGTTPPSDENTRTTILDNGLPAPIPIGVEMPTPSTAGAVLHGELKVTTQPPKDPYKEALYAEMAEQNVWYMSIYVTHLAYLIANKDPEHIQSILIHAEPIITKLWSSGRLAWMGRPLADVVNNLGIILTEGEIDLIQSYAALVYYMMKSRKTSVSVEVNSIIDYADLLYEDEEGELLFDVLKELEDYPNITKSGYDLADDLLEYFLNPYRRMKDSERRQKLLDSINHALLARFPKLHARRSNEEIELLDEQKSTTHKKPLKDQTRRVLRGNRRKIIRHLRSNHSKDVPNIRPNRRSQIIKKRPVLNEKIHSDFNYENFLRRKYTQATQERLMLRRTKPITTLQRRFSIITSGQRFRGIQTQQSPPSSYFIDLLATRRTTDYKLAQIRNFGGKYRVPGYNTDNNNKQFFHYQRGSKKYHGQSRNDVERNIQRYRSSVEPGRDKNSFYYQMKKRYKESERLKKDEGVKLKKKLVQKIVDGSSYSDEEAALKINLIDAMLHGNRSFDVEDVNTTDWHASVRPEEELFLKRMGETEDMWTSSSTSTSGEDTRDSTREHIDNSI